MRLKVRRNDVLERSENKNINGNERYKNRVNQVFVAIAQNPKETNQHRQGPPKNALSIPA